MDLDILKQLVALGVDEVSKFLEFRKNFGLCAQKNTMLVIYHPIFSLHLILTKSPLLDLSYEPYNAF
jgi:hypothetical protein